MTEHHEKSESDISARATAEREAMREAAREAGGRRGSSGPWDIFATLRKTISPADRMALVNLKRPRLPPEDLLEPGQLSPARAARLRELWPAAIGVAALLSALLFAALWFVWPTLAPHSTENAKAATPHVPPPVTARTHSLEAPSIPTAAKQSAETRTVSAAAPPPPVPTPGSPSSEQPPAARAVPEHPRRPKRRTDGVPTRPATPVPKSDPRANAAAVSVPVSVPASPAPSHSSPTTPNTPDFKTPW
jgi:hypothetical protein